MSKTPLPTYVAAGATVAAIASVGYCVYSSKKLRHGKRNLRVRVLYGTTTGTTEKWARQAAENLVSRLNSSCPMSVVEVTVENLEHFQFDGLLESTDRGCHEIVVVAASTHTDGMPPPSCAHFWTLLEDHRYDFRVSKSAFFHLKFAVVGFGSSDYEPRGAFCTAALRVDDSFAAMGASRLLPVSRVTDTMETGPQVGPWLSSLCTSLTNLLRDGESHTHPLPQFASVHATEAAKGEISDEDADANSDSDSDETTAESAADGKGASDLEELAESCASTVDVKGSAKREMVTKRHREQLTKEGYKIIGSHSAVKLCRWTKHQLRGRGGCYKHSFYGITSYQCMEATPSLACANKCVFCWRHHKNPTGTEWKWKMDDPDMIVREGIEQHRKMIRECKGIPGVQPDRFESAMTVRHCALSLVGEPIMYPRINELVDDLHSRNISTFLVTNAQFPEAIESLHPVTQLYVSVDAGTPESLKAVDRPIFADFWERYVDSLKALAKKRQRTIYRLTLVKDRNMSECEDYAKLLALGKPDLIEIKSVTFCGESKASNLTMGSVPWHEEVKIFAETMLSYEGLADEYELACEHQHSCIVLIAHKSFKVNGKWHTWIDFDRFHELVANGEKFTASDYWAPTPDWALYGSDAQGFDPVDTRKYHNRTKRRAKEGTLSEEQLRRYPDKKQLGLS